MLSSSKKVKEVPETNGAKEVAESEPSPALVQNQESSASSPTLPLKRRTTTEGDGIVQQPAEEAQEAGGDSLGLKTNQTNAAESSQ